MFSHVAQHKLEECIVLVVRFGLIRLMHPALVQKAHPEFSYMPECTCVPKPKYTHNVEGAEKRAPNPSTVLGYSSTRALLGPNL